MHVIIHGTRWDTAQNNTFFPSHMKHLIIKLMKHTKTKELLVSFRAMFQFRFQQGDGCTGIRFRHEINELLYLILQIYPYGELHPRNQN